MTTEQTPAVDITDLSFDYGPTPILRNVDLKLQPGSRCLLVGANGAGKTTLLRLIAGKKMSKTPIFVMGQDVFIRTPEGVTYLGTEWANNPVVKADIGVEELLKSMNGEKYRDRRDVLLHVLDVNPKWRMHQCSDGERRRVQLVLGLMAPWKVCLLDEVVTDLDILVRSDLLRYLKRETEERNATIVYASHIFDDVARWVTHISHIRLGTTVSFHDINNFPLLEEYRANAHPWDSPLMRLCIDWLREDRLLRTEERGVPQARLDELKDKLLEDTDKGVFYKKYNYYD